MPAGIAEEPLALLECGGGSADTGLNIPIDAVQPLHALCVLWTPDSLAVLSPLSF